MEILKTRKSEQHLFHNGKRAQAGTQIEMEEILNLLMMYEK